MHPIENPTASARRLSQSVVQVGEMLGLYRAEVARLLEFRCQSISALYDGRIELVPGSDSWEAAVQFVRLYHLLLQRFAGDEVKVYHWLRAPRRDRETALLRMVDGGELKQVVAELELEVSERLPPP